MVIAGGEFRTEDLKGAREMMSLLLDDDELEEKRTWPAPTPTPFPAPHLTRSPPRSPPLPDPVPRPAHALPTVLNSLALPPALKRAFGRVSWFHSSSAAGGAAVAGARGRGACQAAAACEEAAEARAQGRAADRPVHAGWRRLAGAHQRPRRDRV